MSTVVVEPLEVQTHGNREAHGPRAGGETRFFSSRVRQLLAVLVALVIVAGIGVMLVA
jgi:hypothetical protein